MQAIRTTPYTRIGAPVPNDQVAALHELSRRTDRSLSSLIREGVAYVLTAYRADAGLEPGPHQPAA